MNKKYAIFDMDGTLVDSMGYWKNLATEYLTSKGVKNIPDDILERIKPMTMSESADLFVREFLPEADAESVAAEMNHMMEEHYRRDIPLKDSVETYLNALSDAGTVMCVASSTAEPLMRACLSRLNVLGYFQFLLSCETVGAGKDKPDVYYEAAKRMGCCPAETAVYEDALFAVSTAKKAGFYVVGVYEEGAKEHWNEIENLADETIRTFYQEELI